MKSSRRHFLSTAAAGLASAPWMSAAASKSSPAPVSQPGQSAGAISPMRDYLRRHHRNLFTTDSCTPFYNPEIYQSEDFTLKSGQGTTGTQTIPVGGPYKVAAIRNFVTTVARNGVDTYLVNPNASRAWYPSRKVPRILDGYRRGDREFFRGHAICAGITEPTAVEGFLDRMVAFYGCYLDLEEAGVDWVAESARAAREAGMAPWASIRMNDFHGSENIEGSFMNHPLLKNPEMRLKRGSYSPTIRNANYRTPLNYEKQEVRDAMMDQIEEIVNDYEFEGLELDWLRNPNCCEPNAGRETIGMMNDWFRQIRRLTRARSARTGRPYPLGMRIPGTLETIKSIGLDIVTLCREGTLDFISPSAFWCTSWEMPHDELRRAVGDGVAIYGVIEDGVNTLASRSPEFDMTQRLRYISCSPEHLNANAAGKLVLGADGIEWFNFFCTEQVRLPGLTSDYSLLRGKQDLDGLRGRPKHYSFSIWSNFFTQLPFEIPTQLPVVLNAGWQHSFRLPMCEEPPDRNLELVVQVILKAGEKFTALPVSLNGCWPTIECTPNDQLLFPAGSLTHHVPENTGYDFKFPVSLIRDGWNEIIVENGGSQPITVVCIELAVRPGERTGA